MKKNDLIWTLSIVAVLVLSGCGSTEQHADVGVTGDGAGWDPNSEFVDSENLGNEPRFGPDDGAKKRGMFQPIRFEFDSASLRSNDLSTLNKVGDYLQNNPGSKVLVEGNCDQQGTAEYNRALGQRRAQAARSYLIRKGISPSRISTLSYGEDRPIGGDAENRRDEFVVVQ
jgi:peptidoglycan-associated lipoprotein